MVEENTTNIEQLQSLIDQIHSIQKQYPHADVTATLEPNGELRVTEVVSRSGTSVGHQEPTTVTIVNLPKQEVNGCPVAKETQPTQEQLAAIFAHVTNMTAEQAEDLGFQYSLTAKTNFPRIELQIVSFSKYGNDKDQWKCTIVHQSPTDPKHEQYSFQSTYDFETTCHRLWWPVKCEGDEEVEESQQQFVSIPVSEFEGVKSQIKELIELNETRKSETEQLRKWLERVVSALQMK